MKKVFALLLAFTLTAGLFAGCTGTSVQEDTKPQQDAVPPQKTQNNSTNVTGLPLAVLFFCSFMPFVRFLPVPVSKLP